MSPSIHVGSSLPTEAWTILAHFNGKYRLLLETFPPVGDAEEALQRARVRVMNDEKLWANLLGCALFPVNIRHGWVVPASRFERRQRARKEMVTP